jgi:hypothetical protein
MLSPVLFSGYPFAIIDMMHDDREEKTHFSNQTINALVQ